MPLNASMLPLGPQKRLYLPLLRGSEDLLQKTKTTKMRTTSLQWVEEEEQCNLLRKASSKTCN